jgi:hypothetical protein
LQLANSIHLLVNHDGQLMAHLAYALCHRKTCPS